MGALASEERSSSPVVVPMEAVAGMVEACGSNQMPL